MTCFLLEKWYLLQQRDEEYNTDDSADEDVVNNYCYMYATLNTPPDFKVAIWNIQVPALDQVIGPGQGRAKKGSELMGYINITSISYKKKIF